MSGCNIDEANFGRPMPWIGIYIATASLVCAFAMAADTFNGFRYRKFSFPCRYFSLNSTSLTIIAVAIKLSVDLNTPMPRKQDQLSKLSSSVLICTVIGNSMPSLGGMENSELLSNVIALAILVVTSVVNICIQLGTGVIYTFWREHVLTMFLMMLLLALFCCSAISLPTTKRFLELKYNKKRELALRESMSKDCETVTEKLKEHLIKHWVMAHTCSPQFVMARSVTCTASGALCFLSALVLAEGMLRVHMMPWSFRFCDGESDYKWSTTFILVAQTIAVGVGTIAPAYRWLGAIKFRCPKRGNRSYKDEFKLEKYWIQMLVEMQACPFNLHVHNRKCRRCLHSVRKKVLNFCIIVQAGVILGSKLVRLISVAFMSRMLLFWDWFKHLKEKWNANNIAPHSESNSTAKLVSKLDLGRYVLHLEGEEELVHVMMMNNCNATKHYLKMGMKKQPKHLIQLLEKYHSHGFGGVGRFCSDQIPSLDCGQVPNSWALTVVTLTSIAVSLPSIDPRTIDWLLDSVHEGFAYVWLIEDNFNMEQDLTGLRKAANFVWLGVDLYHRWLNVDLHKLSLQSSSPKEGLESLSDAAKKIFMEFYHKPINAWKRENHVLWPVEVLAALSMYKISQTILLDCKNTDMNVSKIILEQLLVTISDVMGACFTNLECVISMECSHTAIEERKRSVQKSVFLLGKAEKIMKILSQRQLPGITSDQMAHIDEWRKLHCLSYSSPSKSSPLESVTSSSNADDLLLNIECQ